MILDLSFINQFVFKQKIKFDDWKVFEQYVKVDTPGYLFKFDLKSGYHHVDIHEDFQKFLGFSWIFKDGSKRFFQYAVLPFGLTSGPFIFTKIVRALVKYWRSYAIKIACFLDDGMGLDYVYSKALEKSIFVKDSLDFAGFIVNLEKSEYRMLIIEKLFIIFGKSGFAL